MNVYRKHVRSLLSAKPIRPIRADRPHSIREYVSMIADEPPQTAGTNDLQKSSDFYVPDGDFSPMATFFHGEIIRESIVGQKPPRFDTGDLGIFSTVLHRRTPPRFVIRYKTPELIIQIFGQTCQPGTSPFVESLSFLILFFFCNKHFTRAKSCETFS